ncbi:MAG: FimV/HubP family polar landmark protein [Ketobacteraceae bacterium]|nr:FimV/HubP family polar landmark protein [Ketobacteraceae bacterium]
MSEPLNAEIELVQVRELTEAEILPNLASQKDFEAAGLQRFHHLTDMQFDVVINNNGRSYIKVKSRKPIREPFVNFLVEVHWPAGRLLREYTLLLDPPNFSLAPPEPVKPATTTTGAPTTTTVTSTPQTTTRSTVSAPATTTPSGGESGGKTYGPTGSSDSLWSIAKALRPSESVSIQQTMIAIQQLNPDAFIDGNINLLKKGQILRGPSAEEARQISTRQAIDLVQQQNRAWKERISGGRAATEVETAQIDTSGRSVGSFEETVRDDDGRLRLVSADSEDAAGASGQGGVGGAADGSVRERAELAEEVADKYRLENEDLKGKVTELEEQVDTSEKLLDLKDDQIAALQARLARMEEEIQRMQQGEGAPDTMEGAMPGMEEPGMLEPVTETGEIETAEEMQPETVDEAAPGDVDYNFQAEEPAEPEVTAEEGAEEEAPKPAIQVEETPKVVIDEPPKQVAETPKAPPTLLEQLTQNPLYMAIAGGGVLVLAVLALIIGRSRSRQEDELDEALVEDFSLNVEEETPDFAEDTAVDESLEAPDEETVPQTSDVLGEADIYIAYGRFPQAIEMLEKAADAEPQRGDIRLKLLETSMEARDQETFMRHYQAVQELAVPDDMAKAGALKEQFLGGDVEPDFGEVTGEGEDTLVMGAAESPVEESPLDESGDLNFDVGEDTLAQPAAEEESSLAEEESNELDFNLDFDTAGEPDASEAAEAEEEFSLDFDVDAGPEEAPTEEEPETAKKEDTGMDFDTDFSLDLDEETAEAPEIEEDEDTVVSFGEAEDSLDFELSEDTDEETLEAPADFDLDVDSVGTEEPVADVGEDTLVAEPDETEAPQEVVIDPSEAAKLADELDLDADFDLDEGVGETAAEAPADDLEFSVETDEGEPTGEALAEDFEAPAIEPEAQEPTEPTAVPTPPAGRAANTEEELDFLTDADETSTKLDLARAYIDMGDREGAKDILDEVLIEGTEDQQGEAKQLLARLD